MYLSSYVHRKAVKKKIAKANEIKIISDFKCQVTEI